MLHRVNRFIIIGLMLLTVGFSPAQADETAVVRAVLFYSPTCSHCHYVITEILVPLNDRYGDQLEIGGIDVTQADGQALYQTAIDHYQIPQDRRGVPTLVVGQVVLVGSGEIPEQFPAIIETGLAEGGIPWPDIPGLVQLIEGAAAGPPGPTATPLPSTPTAVALVPAAVSDRPPVYLAYFFDPTCLECARVGAELTDLETQYAHLVVQRYNVNDAAALNEAMAEKIGLPAEERLLAPAIFVGQECLMAEEISPARLQAIIENPPAPALVPPWAGLDTAQPEATERIVERFKEFGVLAVAGAGLLDGVNPCAFTTIIFFVSYLALVGRRGREILLVGVAFTVAVFLTYLAMGLGLAEVIRQMKSFALVGRVIYGLTALVCLALAGLSLWDYIKIRRGQLTEIALQLPPALKKRIHHTIRTHSRMRGYIAAAFGAGVLVSVFELACTGQVYFPTIVFVTGVADLRWTATAYLVLYNLMFIVPLLAVFLVTYFGTTQQQLTTKFQANAGAVKLGTALLFAALGGWLGYMVLTAG